MSRQDGTAMIVVMILVILLFALAAAMTMTSMAGMRAEVESDTEMRAFYLAESGAQVAMAKLQSAGGIPGDTTFTENIAGGTVSVTVTRLDPEVYRITSSSVCSGHRSEVELHVAVRRGFSIPGALSIMLSRGIEFRAPDIATSVLGSSRISGIDHAPDGSVLGDQSRAVPGLAVNALPGGKDFDLALSRIDPRILGHPVRIDSEADNVSAGLTDLRNYAREFADIKLVGSRVLGSADTGSYGTDAEPRLVYIRLLDDPSLELIQDFEGHGTLVVEADSAGSRNVLTLQDSASWYGMVLLYLTGSPEVPGGSLIRLKHDSKIVGAASIFLNTEEAEVRGVGKFIHASSDARVLYSSELIGETESLMSRPVVEVLSYRLP